MYRLGITLLVCGLLIMGVMGWRLWSLYQPLPAPAPEDPLSGELYRQLLSANMTRVMPDGMVVLPSRDHILSEQQACQQKADCDGQRLQDLSKQQDWLDRLYYTPAGRRVQQEVAVWNHTRRFAAIRDRFPAPDDRSRWQAYTPSGWPVATRSIVPLAFAGINGNNLPSGYHNWLSASHDGQAIIFTRTFELDKPANIRLQIIGKPELNAVANLGTRIIARRPAGTTLELRLPAGKTEVRIPVTTTENPEAQTDGLALQAENEQVVWAGNESLTDAQDNTSTAISNPGLGGNKPFQIFTRDGEPLSENEDTVGQPSTFARENGLLALVGQDGQDVYSLSGLLSQSGLNEATQVYLTLDSGWQSLAQKLLNENFTRNNDSARPRNPEQRTSLVVLNPVTGAILAAASTPTPPEDVHAWDRETYSKLNPTLDPFQFVPWQGGDANQAPGSTFKVLTPMAVLEAAKDDPALGEAVQGTSIGRVAQILGMTTDQSPWQPPLPKTPIVNNYAANESLRWLSRKNLYRADCERDPKATGEPGLREALSESLNTWFAAAAVRMDGERLGEDASQTYLLGMSKRLGFGSYAGLLPGNVPMRRYLPPMQNGRAVGRGDVLNAFLGQMALNQIADNLGSWGNRLVRTSFGQALATTPVQMAQVAATAATGKRPSLHLLQQWNNEPVSYPEGQALDIDMKILREAMKAVPEEGTAASAFRQTELACRTYGKTGTADVPGGGRTAWFIGWMADVEDIHSSQPQVAFSCMVTHASGAGGRVCAPLIRDLLLQAEAGGLQP